MGQDAVLIGERDVKVAEGGHVDAHLAADAPVHLVPSLSSQDK